ncbi:hypothetical protein [Streptomyces sp. 2P-4]|uniref:hypothetical protein n=1 Tax=Streptomyces sp. 2P-4 TaxID=2931974 RepID=UPI0025417DEA|nr:hypothetical protein [Streptomyces sp. 2P-4]
MNPDYLPALGASLRNLGQFAAAHEVDDRTLADIAAELDRARAAVAGARGQRTANRCGRHPGAPADPTYQNGCLFCGPATRRPATPVPTDFTPGDVLRFYDEHGHEAAADRFGPQAVTRAIALRNRHPSTRRPGLPAAPPTEESEY